MYMLSMGRYVHVYVGYGEICTCVCWVWGGKYMCMLSMGRYITFLWLFSFMHVTFYTTVGS